MIKIPLTPDTQGSRLVQAVLSLSNHISRKEKVVYAIDDAFNFLAGSQYDFTVHSKKVKTVTWYYEKANYSDRHKRDLVINKAVSLLCEPLRQFKFTSIDLDFDSLKDIMRLVDYLEGGEYTVYYDAINVYITKDSMSHSVLCTFNTHSTESVTNAHRQIFKDLIL